MTDKKLEIREQILDILRNGKKAGYAPHRPSQLEQTRLKQADLILDLLKAERNRAEPFELIAKRPVSSIDIVDLDADPTGNTSYKEEYYMMPKKWVDEKIRRDG